MDTDNPDEQGIKLDALYDEMVDEAERELDGLTVREMEEILGECATQAEITKILIEQNKESAGSLAWLTERARELKGSR